MNIDEVFMGGYEISNPLSKREVYDLFDKMKQGDESAKAKLVEHNIRLVLYEVKRRFNTVKYNKEDLVSIGNFGLMKAITAFDTSKNLDFSSFAIKCIDNEILMFLRNLKKDRKIDSLHKVINYDKNGHELKVEDTISDDIDIEGEYTDNETHRTIREIVKELPERDREMVMLHFGFYNDKIYTQKQIADIFSISQSYVSRLIKKIVKQIGIQLEQKGIIELRMEQREKEQINYNKGEEKMVRKLKTIYEYFDSYTKEQVDAMLEKLTEDERALITLRYGYNLDNPVPGRLNKYKKDRFYGSLVPKMKRLLANPNKERNTVKKRVIEKEGNTNNLVSKLQLAKQVVQIEKQTSLEKVTLENKKVIKKQDVKATISKDDYLKILELLRTPTFTKMMQMYSPKEAMIISLKLGYIDGKCFKTSVISEFLGIEQQEVIEVTKKALLSYKERITQTIDGFIQSVIEDQEITTLSDNSSFHK